VNTATAVAYLTFKLHIFLTCKDALVRIISTRVVNNTERLPRFRGLAHPARLRILERPLPDRRTRVDPS